MHLRFSTCLGLPIVEEGGEGILAVVSGILIHPDTARVEGFFAQVPSLFHSEECYVSMMDIVRFGTRFYVRSADVLSPPEERIRLQELLADSRTIIGQSIRTESGVSLGVCADVQLNTDSMMMEWIFPRKWKFFWGIALPVSEIVEVRDSAIIVRDRSGGVQEEVTSVDSIQSSLPTVDIPDPGLARTIL